MLRLALVLLMFASTVNAEFTPAEKVEAVDQIGSLRDAINAAYYAMQHAKSVPADADEVEDFVGWQMQAWQNHFNAFLYLLDVQGDTNARTAAQVLAGPRADVVALALSRIQSFGYDFARGKLDAIPGMSSSLLTAKDLADDAIAGRAGIDATLAYTEPRMEPNVLQPGASRVVSAVAGPHGDYRAAGRAINAFARNHVSQWQHLSVATAACPGWIPGSRGSAFAVGHLRLIGQVLVTAMGLLAGLEQDTGIITGTGLNVKENLDVMEAGGTTARDRSFFRVQFALEILLMWTHTGSEPFDINGRHTARGITYDLTAMGQVWANAIRNRATACASGDEDAFLSAVASGIEVTDAAWGNMDNVGYHGMLILKHFQVFPPPGPGGGGGGGECPECPPACAQYEAQLLTTQGTDAIEYKAVCVEIGGND